MRQMQKRLYEFLKGHQRTGSSFTVDEAIEFTGYAADTLRTYLSKNLRGVWVTAVDERHCKVHDFDGVSPVAFADAMSQNTRLAFDDEHEWRAQLKRLLAQGVQHGYPVASTVRELIREIEPEAR